MKRHHGSHIKVPEYTKYPIQKKFIEVDPTYDSSGNGYNICGKDWDSGKPANGAPNDGSGNDLELGGWNRGTYYTRRVGEYEWTLENWRMVFHPDRAYGVYRVDQPTLDFSNISMTESESAYKNGCYATSDRGISRYMRGLAVLPYGSKPEEYNKNLFIKNKYMTNFNVDSEGKVFTDPNAVSYYFEPQSNRILTISRTKATSKFAAYRMYGTPVDGNEVTDTVVISDETTNSFVYRTFGVQLGILVVVSDDGTSVNDLQKIIQIEEGEVATPYSKPKDLLKDSDWHIPKKEDFTQLFGMLGNDLNLPNIFHHCVVSPNDKEIPWLTSWENSSMCNDILGVRLQPVGHKGNSYYSAGDNGDIHSFGRRFGLMSYDSLEGTDESASATMWVSQTHESWENLRVCWDKSNETINPPLSINYWQRNIRFCRRLTDQELGYKLWVNEANNSIDVTTLDAPQPSGTTELPNGLLRGLAVRWFDNQNSPTKVETTLSYLKSEVSKTANDKYYRWYGWY